MRIANGSLRELETQLILAGRRRLAPDRLPPLLQLADEVGRLLTGLDRSLGARLRRTLLFLFALPSSLFP